MSLINKSNFLDRPTGAWGDMDFVPAGTCFGGDGGNSGGGGGSSSGGTYSGPKGTPSGGLNDAARDAHKDTRDSLTGGGDDRNDHVAPPPPKPSPPRPADLAPAPPQPSPPRPDDIAAGPPPASGTDSTEPLRPSPPRPDDVATARPANPETDASTPPQPSPPRPADPNAGTSPSSQQQGGTTTPQSGPSYPDYDPETGYTRQEQERIDELKADYDKLSHDETIEKVNELKDQGEREFTLGYQAFRESQLNAGRDGIPSENQDDPNSLPSPVSSRPGGQNPATIPGRFRPIVLDLDGDGVELVGLNQSSAYFDIDGDGLREHTGWAGPDDGLLAIDLGGGGVVSEPNEISFALWDPAAQTDLEGLALAFDSNDDDVFDGSDARFNEFRIWQDSDQDGVSDDGELSTLADLDITSINLSGVADDGAGRPRSPSELETRDGNQIFGLTDFSRGDGSTGKAADVAFLTENSPDASPAPTGSSTDTGDEGRPEASRLLDDNVSYEELWSQPDGANAGGQTATTQSAVAGDDGPAASLLNNQLDQLVSAMSSFDPPSSDAATDYEVRLQKPTEPTLAENLQS